MPGTTTPAIDFLHEAEIAVKYVDVNMDFGAANRVGDVIATGGVSRICVYDMRQQLEKEGVSALATDEALIKRALTALAYGCGNCGEQSAVAFLYLFRKGIRPLEWMHFTDADHAFVVLGRAWDKSFDWDVPHWGPLAVVCDPWKKRAYPATQLKSVWPGCTPTISYRVK